MIYLLIYALGAALVLGWLRHKHLSAPTRFDRVPIHILILLPLLWPAVLAAGVLAVVGVFINVLVFSRRE